MSRVLFRCATSALPKKLNFDEWGLTTFFPESILAFRCCAARCCRTGWKSRAGRGWPGSTEWSRTRWKVRRWNHLFETESKNWKRDGSWSIPTFNWRTIQKDNEAAAAELTSWFQLQTHQISRIHGIFLPLDSSVKQISCLNPGLNFLVLNVIRMYFRQIS